MIHFIIINLIIFRSKNYQLCTYRVCKLR